VILKKNLLVLTENLFPQLPRLYQFLASVCSVIIFENQPQETVYELYIEVIKKLFRLYQLPE
jgi:hypothetical protein